MTESLVSRVRVVAVAASGCLVVGLVGQVAAQAAPGPGTWTKIGTPAGARTTILSRWGHEGQMSITGTTSSDVTSVNVYCLRGSGTDVDATTVATTVPVTSGAFATTVPVPGAVLSPRCRLRALPSGVNPQTAYLASYAGPVMNLDSWRYLPSQDTVQLRASTGQGMLVADGIGTCSATILATVLPDQTVAGGSDGCLYALRGGSLGDTHSSARVDGHEAFTTGAALSYGLTPPRLASTSFHLVPSGGVRWTEVMPLARCASGDAFPPSAGSCPSMVSTGVEIRTVSTYAAGGHQVRMRTELRSLDGKRHAVRLDYSNRISGPASGGVGYRFPGRTGFHASSLGQVVTRLGTGSGTMLARSNRVAVEGDPAVATRAITWSRTPARLAFSPTAPDTFAMSYRLTVPKGGSVHLGFTDSDGTLTSQAVGLGRRGEAGMMPAPRITSPAPGGAIEGRTTKVTGVVTAGANGLPTSVTVNGHAAQLKVTGASRARYSVTFTEALGKHTLEVVARDAAGNRRTASVKVRNR